MMGRFRQGDSVMDGGRVGITLGGWILYAVGVREPCIDTTTLMISTPDNTAPLQDIMKDNEDWKEYAENNYP